MRPADGQNPGGRQVSFRQSQIGDSAAMGIVSGLSQQNRSDLLDLFGCGFRYGLPWADAVPRSERSASRAFTRALVDICSGRGSLHKSALENQAPAATWKGKIFGPGDCGLIGRCSCTSKRVAPTAVRKMLDRPGTAFRLSPNTAGMRQEHGPATEAALHGGAIKMARAVHHQVAVGVAAIGARAPKIRDGRNHSGGHAYRTIVTQASRGPPVHAHPSTGSRDRRTGT